MIDNWADASVSGRGLGVVDGLDVDVVDVLSSHPRKEFLHQLGQPD